MEQFYQENSRDYEIDNGVLIENYFLKQSVHIPHPPRIDTISNGDRDGN